MTELIRDTTFGHLVRFVTRKRFLKYAEEADPSLWKQFINEDASGNAAHHGTIEPKEQQKKEEGEASSDDEKNELDRHLTGAHSIGGIRTRDEYDKNQGDQSSGSSDRTRIPDDGTVNIPSGVKIDSEKGRDIWVVDWFGPNDPENPVNWSLGKKFFVTFEICLLTTAVYIGSAIYTPGLMTVTEQFGVSEEVAILGLCLFVAGYGIGPMLWAPMSEIPQIGRNPIYIGTLLVFVCLQPAVGFSVNIGMLLAFRFITGFVGSPVLATGGASLSDMYVPRKRAYAIAVWGIAAVCGPVMGPVVGGWAAMFKGWQWTIWELSWLSGGAFIMLFFFLPETSANNILYRRTRRLRKITGNSRLTCAPELAGESMTGKDIAMMVLVKPFTLNFQEPMVFLLNLYIALVYGLLYIWFESFPIVFEQIYGFNLGEEGLAFLGILVGAILVLPPFFAYLYYVMEPQFDEAGNIKPEKRLPPAIVGGPLIVICLFWFGWSAGRTHWIMPIIGSSFFSMGAVLLFNSVLNYLPDAYPEHAASVLAGNDFMRSSFGAGFPLFATQMYTKLGVDWASTLLGLLALVFVPIPFFLWKYGEVLRKKYSKLARKDI